LEEGTRRVHVLEGRLTVSQFDRRDADRPYVSPAIVSNVHHAASVANDFRCHPGRRAYAAVTFFRFVHHPARSKVHQLHLAFPRENDAVAADISVYHVVLVQVNQSLKREGLTVKGLSSHLSTHTDLSYRKQNFLRGNDFAR